MSNGNLDESSLERCLNGVRLIKSAADSADRLGKAFRKAFGKDLKATDGYRSLAEQKRIFLQRYRRTYAEYAPGRVDRRTYNKRIYYRYRGAAAAVPGTSNHGLGITLDLASGVNTSFSSKEYLWMKANAGAYGWNNTEGRSVNEPWHWTYDAAKDTHNKPATSSKPKPKPAEPVLLEGSAGAEVRTVQRGLNKKYPAYRHSVKARRGYLLTVDGHFGPATTAWVKEYQRRKGLSVDGVIGPRTRAALEKDNIL